MKKHRPEEFCYYLGRTVQIVIDRPIGSSHPRYPDTVYPVNYGYIPGTFAGDGEPKDVYLLGVDSPVEGYIGKIIAVIHREDDREDKLVAAPEGMVFSEMELIYSASCEKKENSNSLFPLVLGLQL